MMILRRRIFSPEPVPLFPLFGSVFKVVTFFSNLTPISYRDVSNLAFIRERPVRIGPVPSCLVRRWP